VRETVHTREAAQVYRRTQAVSVEVTFSGAPPSETFFTMATIYMNNKASHPSNPFLIRQAFKTD